MVAKKRKSKRQTLLTKFKIIKRTKEHHDRVAKGKKIRAPGKKNKDHIPNAWPYKADLLREIQNAKDKMEETKIRQREKRREEFSKRRQGIMDVDDDEEEISAEQQMENLAEKTAMNAEDMGSDDDSDEEDGSYNKTAGNSAGQNSRRAYLKELRTTIKRADVILQVLDARDPVGTKSTLVEDMVLSNDRKKLVYVLNKADLVPREVLAGWLTYLRKFHPTIPFKCNTQSQKGNLGSEKGKVNKQQEGSLKTNHAIGGEELLGLLKNYCRVGDSKSIIAVGAVGFPNVGKSSLINSLMRTRSVGVSATPGYTKVAQEVILDKNIRLIDSPGIVFADGDSSATALRNCVNVEEMEDVYTPIQAILEKCPQAYLMQLYAIPKFKNKDCMAFLALAAKATGKLKKGGIPNTDAAARSILHDWNTGKIKFYCMPPKHVSGGGMGEKDSKIVNSFSEEFNLDGMDDADVRVLDMLQNEELNNEASGDSAPGVFIPVESVGNSLEV